MSVLCELNALVIYKIFDENETKKTLPQTFFLINYLQESGWEVNSNYSLTGMRAQDLRIILQQKTADLSIFFSQIGTHF